VAYVVRSWPRLSQTFVLSEVIALERIGVPISIFSMTRAGEDVVQSQVAQVVASVDYLDAPAGRSVLSHLRLAALSSWRYLATFAYALTHRQLLGGYTQSGAIEAFHKAVLIADRLRARRNESPVTHIHAHFAHDPALIGLLAHRLTGLPFSFTAHARDLYQIPDRALLGRAQEASAVVTCCNTNLEHIVSVVGDAGPPIELIYHGVDLERFQPVSGRRENRVPLIISVGRLVEKKGFDDLLGACARIAATGRRFRCEIYGEGPSRGELEALRDRLGLAEIVSFCGQRTQDELLRVYQRADVFALTPRVTDQGDRDGLPNVLVEAMACGIPIVSTRVGGIAEAVANGSNGLLAAAHDPASIASCLEDLLDDADRRRRLGEAAAHDAVRFDGKTAAFRLAALFRHAGVTAS
jgi:glycosyltransferase involved in cell wall biosynthesis